jgi:hypothetical protein
MKNARFWPGLVSTWIYLLHCIKSFLSIFSFNEVQMIRMNQIEIIVQEYFSSINKGDQLCLKIHIIIFSFIPGYYYSISFSIPNNI